MQLVGCLYYLYQWRTVKQISDNEIYLLIKYIKSVIWRVVKRLSYIQDALCLKVKNELFSVTGLRFWGNNVTYKLQKKGFYHWISHNGQNLSEINENCLKKKAITLASAGTGKEPVWTLWHLRFGKKRNISWLAERQTLPLALCSISYSAQSPILLSGPKRQSNWGRWKTGLKENIRLWEIGRNRRREELYTGLNCRRRIKSRLPFAGIIMSSPYSTRFQDKG